MSSIFFDHFQFNQPGLVAALASGMKATLSVGRPHFQKPGKPLGTQTLAQPLALASNAFRWTLHLTPLAAVRAGGCPTRLFSFSQNFMSYSSSQSRFIPVPMPPQTTSPVPWLTSIHSTRSRGPYGDRRYRGNCDGYLIKDLLRFYRPRHVLDPMTGSGTCQDVCSELRIPCTSFDLRSGQDATDQATYQDLPQFDFIWLHPPYWRMIRYNNHEACLSRAPTLADFERQLKNLIDCCRSVLTPNGILAILMGDYCDRTEGFVSLTYSTKKVAFGADLKQAATDIIRFQHGNTSSRRSYDSSFIPGLHDVCMLFKQNTNPTTDVRPQTIFTDEFADYFI